MKKLIKKTELYYFCNGEKIYGKNKNMTGDCSGLSGECTGLRGECTGLRGGCSGLSGNFDDCEIPAEERENGVNIEDLIGE